MAGKTHQAFLSLSFFLLAAIPCCLSLPLSTNKRWIVDANSGKRVKLACVNWPSHLEPMLAEGLHEKPLEYIVGQLSKENFNCVRLTWATYMFTRADYGNITVAQTFDSLGLTASKDGIARNNPQLLNMTHIQAYETVVDELGKQGLMVILDNHVSRPTWCCGENDGNGFFGDTYFDPEEWIRGLTNVATQFKGKSQVIGIGMRNELRGPNQDVSAWYQYINEGATAVHKANPNLLVSVSGLSYANDLTFLKERPFETNFDNKLIFEAHWYPWSGGPPSVWEDEPLNKLCPNKTQLFINQTAFMNKGEYPVPLVIGEFGIDQTGVSRNNDHFMSCFLAYATDEDLDWGLWALQGSYYFRENKTDVDEVFGIFEVHWNRIRNPTLQGRLKLIKRKNQDLTSHWPTTYVMFHPQSGSCVRGSTKEVYAGNCKKQSRWTHDGDGTPIKLEGTDLCLKAVGDGLPPIISTDCSSQQSQWTRLSESKLHLAAKNETGEYLCLHKESPFTSKIFTKKCICIEDDQECQKNPMKDPTIQWFKLVPSNA